MKDNPPLKIETSFQYLNAFESLRRANAALEVARVKLSPVDFAVLAPQIQREIDRITTAIGAFQEALVNDQVQGLTWNYSTYLEFEVYSNALFPTRSTLSWGYPPSSQIIVGYPGSAVDPQLRLQL
jgi:hypothetical protein